MSDKFHDAERERAAIVEWLRELSARQKRLSENGMYSLEAKLTYRTEGKAFATLAEHIERGDHHKDSKHG